MSDEFEDFLSGLTDDDGEDEAPAPARTSKKKAKKKAASKPAAPPAPAAPAAPARKKKVARKPAAPPEEEYEEEEEAPAPAPKRRGRPPAAEAPAEEDPAPKRRGPKPGAKRAPRATAAGSDVLAGLGEELQSLVADAGASAEVDLLRAQIRSAKKLSTQLSRFADRAAKASEQQDTLVEKLEAQLAKLEG